jgi:hypothetical protein
MYAQAFSRAAARTARRAKGLLARGRIGPANRNVGAVSDRDVPASRSSNPLSTSALSTPITQ